MATIKAHTLHHRLGIHSTPTDRLGAPSTYKWIPVSQNGNTLKGDAARTPLVTEHKDAGARYVNFNRRNANTKTLTTSVWPQFAKTLLGLGIDINATDLPDYFRVESFWLDSDGLLSVIDGTATEVGTRLGGCISNGVTVNVDRTGDNPLEVVVDTYVNQDRGLDLSDVGGVALLPTWPTGSPYAPSDVFVDFAYSDAAGVFASPKWSGDDGNVRTINLQLNQNMTPDVFSPNADDSLHKTWTSMERGNPELQVTLSLKAGDPEYLKLHRGREVRKIAARLAAVGPSPSGNSTSTDTIAADSTTDITVGDASGFDTGDVVLIVDQDNGTFAVHEIASIAVNTLTMTENIAVAVDGSGTALSVQNTAWEITVESADVQDPGPLEATGNVRTLNVTAVGTISPGVSELMTLKAYDDDGI